MEEKLLQKKVRTVKSFIDGVGGGEAPCALSLTNNSLAPGGKLLVCLDKTLGIGLEMMRQGRARSNDHYIDGHFLQAGSKTQEKEVNAPQKL